MVVCRDRGSASAMRPAEVASAPACATSRVGSETIPANDEYVSLI